MEKTLNWDGIVLIYDEQTKVAASCEFKEKDTTANYEAGQDIVVCNTKSGMLEFIEQNEISASQEITAFLNA